MHKWLVISFCFFGVAFASQAVYPFKTTRQQEQFQRLTKGLRCLVCQNENLADSNASLAMDLRKQVYQMVVTGKTDDQIKHYMVARYGDFVLFKPPFQWNTLLLWSAPFLLLLVAGVVLFRTIRHPERESRHPERESRHPERESRHPERESRHPELDSGSPRASTEVTRGGPEANPGRQEEE